jgi:hypothetical protein
MEEKKDAGQHLIDRHPLLPRCYRHIAAVNEALHPETKRGGAPGKAGGGKAKNAESASFVSDTARKTGRSKRTIEQQVKIATDLAPDVMEAVKASPLANEKGRPL